MNGEELDPNNVQHDEKESKFDLLLTNSKNLNLLTF